MKTWKLNALVDLDRYPIDTLDSPEGVSLVRRAREALRNSGACDLEGFMLPQAIEASTLDALAVRGGAYRTQTTHDIDFSGQQRESFQQDDPRHIRVRTAKEGTAFDRIPAQCPVRALYADDHMLQFVGAALEVDPLFRSEDPLGALNLMYYAPTDELLIFPKIVTAGIPAAW